MKRNSQIYRCGFNNCGDCGEVVEIKTHVCYMNVNSKRSKEIGYKNCDIEKI